MTDAGTHVPLIANWPKTIPGKQVKEELVDFSDFLPTLLDAAKSPLPTNLTLDGQSFLPQITGKQGNPRKWVHCYYRRGNGESGSSNGPEPSGTNSTRPENSTMYPRTGWKKNL